MPAASMSVAAPCRRSCSRIGGSPEAATRRSITGDGDWADPPKEFSEDPAVVKLCSDAFEAVWERAVDHEKYTV
ncbi:DUF6879 family protein [Streptomyces sp. NPDC004129]